MTQREDLVALVGPMRADKMAKLSKQLRLITDAAQNAPPQGASDGSLNVDEWNAARDLLNALSFAEGKLSRLQHVLRIDVAPPPKRAPKPTLPRHLAPHDDGCRSDGLDWFCVPGCPHRPNVP